MARDTELIRPDSPATAWLALRVSGPSRAPFPLRHERTVIGRESERCAIDLDDLTVSGEHAAVVYEQGRYVLYDLASRNGTFLNGQRIERRMLYDGDEIRIGNSLLIFKQA